MNTGSDQSRIDMEAAEWHVRLSEGGLSAAEQTALAAWQARDARHAQALSAMGRIEATATGLSHLAHLIPTEALAPRRRRPWRAIAGLAAAAAVLLALAPTVTDTLNLLGDVRYETAVGETRTLHLADGTLVSLGARSRIDVSFTAAQRRVRVVDGAAFFDVAALPQSQPPRPFVVEAGDAVIRDIGTKFDVNRSGDTLRVAVVEGAVEVHTPRAAAPALVAAGQKLEAVARKTGGLTVSAPTPVPVDVAYSPWRQGRLIYENARLGDLIADMNRYYEPGIALGPDVGDLRITASLRPSEVASFLPTLASMLPISITQDRKGVFRVDPKKD